MATNWSIEAKTKTSTTDNFSVETVSKSSTTDNWSIWDAGSLVSPSWQFWHQNNWDSVPNIWSFVGAGVTWTIDGGATARDSD